MGTKRVLATLAVAVAALAAAWGIGKNSKINSDRLPVTARTAIVQEHKKLSAEVEHITNLLEQGKTEEASKAIYFAWTLADTLSKTDTKYELLEGQLKILRDILRIMSTYNTNYLVYNNFGTQLKEYKEKKIHDLWLNDNGIIYLIEARRYADSDVARETPQFRQALINFLASLAKQRIELLQKWQVELSYMRQLDLTDGKIKSVLGVIIERIQVYQTFLDSLSE
ncbi:MAG: hypothetical protein ABIJ21_06625 [Nanoarchaeota archaeon]